MKSQWVRGILGPRRFSGNGGREWRKGGAGVRLIKTKDVRSGLREPHLFVS